MSKTIASLLAIMVVEKRKAYCLLGRVLDRLAGTAVSAEALEAVASALARSVDDPEAWRSFRDVAHRCSNQKKA
jgi:hypothetical protein